MTRYLLFLFLFFGNVLSAQVYVEGGNTRHRFAQLNLGVDFRHYPSQGTKTAGFNETGEITQASLGSFSQASIVIGGTHFWGHADFFIAIPVVNLNHAGFTPHVETGARYLPWRIVDKKIRPFVGFGWVPSTLRLGEGAEKLRHQLPLAAGLVYNRKNLLVELGAAYDADTEYAYYIAPSHMEHLKVHQLRITFGVKWILETTLGAEKSWRNGRTKFVTDSLANAGKLNTWTIGAGPSSGIFLKAASHNSDLYPYMSQPKVSNTFPELSVGYYFHKPDLQTSLVYRSVSWKQKGFGHEQVLNRKALTLEAYHFFADYHGFSPFIGLGVSREWLTLEEKLPDEETARFGNNLYRPTLVTGWDIRPDRLQVIYLRTMVRWSPALDLPTYSGKKFALDQIEFNFIQCIILLDRIF